MWRGSLLITALWLGISCQEIKDCTLETSTDFAIARFYHVDSAEQQSKTVAFRSITEQDVTDFYLTSMSDTLDDDTLNAIGLFINPQVEQVTYLFATDTINYELTLEYTPHLRIYYEECDPVYSFQLDTAYSTQFDSVVITNKFLDKIVPTNVEIYF